MGSRISTEVFKDDEKIDFTFILLNIGKSGVAKSSIISQYTND